MCRFLGLVVVVMVVIGLPWRERRGVVRLRSGGK